MYSLNYSFGSHDEGSYTKALWEKVRNSDRFSELHILFENLLKQNIQFSALIKRVFSTNVCLIHASTQSSIGKQAIVSELVLIKCNSKPITK